MKSLCLLAISLLVTSARAEGASYKPQPGDILFQTSMSSQSVALQKATHSRYSHMGVVFPGSGGPVVLEAVEPVSLTALEVWVARGEGRHYVAKRLRNAGEVLTPDAVAKLRSAGEAFLGRHYDLAFEWSDDRLYCSELVWKMYHRVLSLELGRLQHLRDFDLSDPTVQAKVRERWHGAPPGDELVISPGQMFASGLLETVYEQ